MSVKSHTDDVVVKENVKGDDEKEFIINSTRVKTLEAALEEANIDLDVWQVESFHSNSWDVTAFKPEFKTYTNYQIKLYVKRKKSYIHDEIMKMIKEELQPNSFTKYPVLSDTLNDPNEEKCMLEISLFDHHFGKLAWEPETNSEYDLKIAAHLFEEAVKDLILKARGFNVEQILFPIGSDFLHINNNANQTVHGTTLDSDSRLAKIFFTAKMAVINAIECCKRIAPVKIMWVPGNHDFETSFYLVNVLEAWYREDDNVQVDIGPRTRKFHQYGKTLLGFTHGDQEKQDNLPLIMSEECKHLLNEVSYREWHIGHYHKKKQMKYLSYDSYAGTGVRVIPSLCGTDAWHYMKGYIKGVAAAEAYLWGKENGFVAQFSVPADKLMQNYIEC